MSSNSNITDFLIDWSNGDQEALDKLVPLVVRELHRLAHYHIYRQQPGNTLQTTALINETYLKLINQNRVKWQNRAHFFGVAAEIMRRVLLNYIRDQQRLKRGGRKIQISLSEANVLSDKKSEELIVLDEALERLCTIDKRKSKVVELRYFGGLSVEETAEVLQVSPITVMRDWAMAKAWLAREIKNEL